jgi:hypothetical protein
VLRRKNQRNWGEIKSLKKFACAAGNFYFCITQNCNSLSWTSFSHKISMKITQAFTMGISALLLSAVVSCSEIKTTVGHNAGENTTAQFTFSNVPSPTAVNAAAVPVPLASAFDTVGICKDGDEVSDGLDGGGFACSAELLGASQVWNGVTFKIGSPGASNVVTTAGQSIPLPAGTFSSLRLLMVAVNGNQESNDFLVTYGDNTVQTNAQSVSDWFTPTSYPGESQVLTMNYRNQSDGTKDEQTFYIYGYSFNLNKTNAVKSVTLPDNSNVKVFALTLVP